MGALAALPSLSQQRAYRTTYERFFYPIGLFIAKLGISANVVSLAGVVFAVLSATAFYFSQNQQFIFIYLAIVFIGLSSLADMVDGSVARANKAAGKVMGKWGGLLDPTMDRYGEAFIILGIMLSNYVPPEFVFFCFVGMIMASYVRARAESLGPGPDGKPLFISVGIERKEKIIMLTVGAAVEAILIHLNIQGYWPYIRYGAFTLGPMSWGVLIVGIFSHIAAYQRLMLAKKYLNYRPN
jgi:phosphatidylglycerophosphate synthase